MKNASGAMIALIAALAAVLPANSASPAPQLPLGMVTGAVTSQPIGHYEFCQTHKSECSIKSRDIGASRVTARGWEIVRQVNAKVNRDIMPMTDMEIFGKEEFWAYPTDAGDCEDFVLLKRRMLMEAGFSPSDLLITVVRKPDGEGHAVLTVRSSEGDFVLDNLSEDVKIWHATPYTFLKRQATFDTGRWVTIENGRDVLVGALN